MRVSAVAFLTLLSIATAVAAQPWHTPNSDFGGAVPLNRNEWYSFQDYPMEAIRSGEEGYVTVSFTIGTDGLMSDCRVARSSGFAELDHIPCKLLPIRA